MSELALQQEVNKYIAPVPTMTVFLEGEMGQPEFEEISAQLRRFADRRVRNVVLDFADVSHIDYRIVRPLLARADSFRALGGDIKLCGLSPYLTAVIRSTGTYEMFDTFVTVAEAHASFSTSK
jgi:anti-sigma B factor antagonist